MWCCAFGLPCLQMKADVGMRELLMWVASSWKCWAQDAEGAGGRGVSASWKAVSEASCDSENIKGPQRAPGSTDRARNSWASAMCRKV